MIIDGDTLPYARETRIEDGDTLYSAPCHSFEKNSVGAIINLSDAHCFGQGNWIQDDGNGKVETGIYEDNKRTGIWKIFINDKLTSEEETVSVQGDTYLIYQAEYDEMGVKTVTLNIQVFGFAMKHVWTIFIILMVLFFGRVLVSSYFINCEEDTDNSPIFIKPSTDKKSNSYHSLRATYSLWISKSKPANEFTRKLNNNLSTIFTILFLAFLIIAMSQSF